MQTNTAHREQQHTKTGNCSNPALRPEPYTVKNGHYVGEDGFVVPKNFEEFNRRFPGYVERWIGTRRMRATREDVQDWSQELLLHLTALPPMSKFREAGKRDVIETFDPNRHYGANKRRFLNFVNLCLSNKLKSLLTRARSNPLTRSQTLSLWTGAKPNADGIVGDEYCHSRSPQLRYAAESKKEQYENRQRICEFLQFVEQEQSPELHNVLYALASTRTNAEAIDLVGEATFTRTYRRLRILGECFLTGTPVPKQRRPHRTRTRTAQA